jgi:hypothetical protein
MPVIPALRMLRQEDWEFEAYLDCIARSKKKKKKPQLVWVLIPSSINIRIISSRDEQGLKKIKYVNTFLSRRGSRNECLSFSYVTPSHISL